MAYAQGKLDWKGHPVDTRRRLTRPIGIEIIKVEPIFFGDIVVPAPEVTFERSIAGRKDKGGHNGKRNNDDWNRPKPEPMMGRHELLAEAFEDYQLLVESEQIVEPTQPQPWSPEMDPDFMFWYHGFMAELAKDAFWRIFEQRLIDSTDDQDLACVMDFGPMPLAEEYEVLRADIAARKSVDLYDPECDNFADGFVFDDDCFGGVGVTIRTERGLRQIASN